MSPKFLKHLCKLFLKDKIYLERFKNGLFSTSYFVNYNCLTSIREEMRTPSRGATAAAAKEGVVDEGVVVVVPAFAEVVALLAVDVPFPIVVVAALAVVVALLAVVVTVLAVVVMLGVVAFVVV